MQSYILNKIIDPIHNSLVKILYYNQHTYLYTHRFIIIKYLQIY